MPKYLIIGNSAGGLGAAEAIREVDLEGAITIVSQEPHHAYSRPLLSEYLCRERTEEEILYRQADFYQQYNIQVILGQRVVRLHLEERQVELKSGEKIDWEKLLLFLLKQ